MIPPHEREVWDDAWRARQGKTLFEHMRDARRTQPAGVALALKESQRRQADEIERRHREEYDRMTFWERAAVAEANERDRQFWSGVFGL